MSFCDSAMESAVEMSEAISTSNPATEKQDEQDQPGVVLEAALHIVMFSVSRCSFSAASVAAEMAPVGEVTSRKLSVTGQPSLAAVSGRTQVPPSWSWSAVVQACRSITTAGTF